MTLRRFRTPSPRRLRVVSYNILLGAERRESLVMKVLARTGADVIALQEVCNLALVEQIADRFGMTVHIGPPSDGGELNLAVLTRLPVRRSVNHQHVGRMLRSHLEVEVESAVGGTATVGIHCMHLAARFGERANGEARRIRELACVIGDIERRPGIPHLIVGDFNAVAPGDGVAATAFLRRMTELRRAKLVVRQADGLMGPRVGRGMDARVDAAWLAAGIDPRLEVGIPQLPAILGPLTMLLPRSRRLDELMTRRIERWTVQRLLDLGYTDCYRHHHPRARGYTCATWLPAARIDYIFASPELASCVTACDVIGGRVNPDADSAVASDHLPVVADFVA